jgi:hypothetical protein
MTDKHFEIAIKDGIRELRRAVQVIKPARLCAFSPLNYR